MVWNLTKPEVKKKFLYRATNSFNIISKYKEFGFIDDNEMLLLIDEIFFTKNICKTGQIFTKKSVFFTQPIELTQKEYENWKKEKILRKKNIKC